MSYLMKNYLSVCERGSRTDAEKFFDEQMSQIAAPANSKRTKRRNECYQKEKKNSIHFWAASCSAQRIQR